MANRPVFMICERTPRFRELTVPFQYHSGFSVSQKQKSIASLHSAFLSTHREDAVLEISSKSLQPLGVRLSAFNLMTAAPDGRRCSVETLFQAGKVFEGGGPYTDLLDKTSREAKGDPRLRESGGLVGFRYGEMRFPLSPATFFYDWLYISALRDDPELGDGLMDYTAFTDIEFNPQRSLNCQARSAAIYVSLRKQDLLEQALESPEAFCLTVYGKPLPSARG